jgi:serine/threonine-protein kinase
MLSGLLAAVVVANRPPERRRAAVETKAAEAPSESPPLPAEPPPPAPEPSPAVARPSPAVVTPPAEQAPGSATFPVNSLRLDARRDLFRVSTAFAALIGLEPGETYVITEFGAPPNRPPLFFLLAGQGLSADEAVGTVSGISGTRVTGARAAMFFSAGPQAEGEQPRRTVRVENVKTYATANVTVHPSQVSASLSSAFELKGLDGMTTYQLTLASEGEGARTRGPSGSVVRKVACARQTSEEVWYAGDDSNGFFREQQFLLVEGRPMDVRGASAVRCGFIDDDPADNQGELELRITPKGRTRGMEPVAAEVRGSASDSAKRLYEEGVTLSRKRKFPEAELRLLKCLELEPVHPPCYLALGALKARTHQLEEGATYYRIFLRLAPDDARAPLVKKILAEYDKSHRLE